MNASKGLFQKYRVERVDGKSDGTVIGCERGSANSVGEVTIPADYFILKLNSGNKYELDALETYARSCKEDLPLLSRDLFEKVLFYRRRFNLL